MGRGGDMKPHHDIVEVGDVLFPDLVVLVGDFALKLFLCENIGRRRILSASYACAHHRCGRGTSAFFFSVHGDEDVFHAPLPGMLRFLNPPSFLSPQGTSTGHLG